MSWLSIYMVIVARYVDLHSTLSTFCRGRVGSLYIVLELSSCVVELRSSWRWLSSCYIDRWLPVDVGSDFVDVDVDLRQVVGWLMLSWWWRWCWRHWHYILVIGRSQLLPDVALGVDIASCDWLTLIVDWRCRSIRRVVYTLSIVAYSLFALLSYFTFTFHRFDFVDDALSSCRVVGGQPDQTTRSSQLPVDRWSFWSPDLVDFG